LQKFTERIKGMIRIDATPNFPQLFEKLRFFFEKVQNLSASKIKGHLHPMLKLDDFINCFLQIYDEIITINSQNTEVNLYLRGTLSAKIN